MKDIPLIVPIMAYPACVLAILVYTTLTPQTPEEVAQTQKILAACWQIAKYGMWGFAGYIILSMISGAARGTAEVFGGLKYVAYDLPREERRSKQVEYGPHGSVIAYRYFECLPDGELYSVGKGVARPNNPITRRPAGSYRGGWNISDRVPTIKNTAGIYAAKQPYGVLDDYRHPGLVLAKVELSGRIVEHEYGYRAQRCNVLEILEVL